MAENILGRNIAQRRESLGLYQQDLAQQVNVTRQAVSAWETGKTEPSIGMIEEIARVLRCKKTDLIEPKFDLSVTAPNGTETFIEVKSHSKGKQSEYDAVASKLADEGITNITSSELLLLKFFRKLNEQEQALALSDLIKKSVSQEN